eukprot:CAMPEP_0115516992 /NCGR_PEP_ID=MMETSP0271-20121206/77072_1 /TAXON_ID=71861 /ORGANISM="Scrippsiella trochoidea, Strain CCMP3099" /LENGTH=38 /DNA_ID= /DNA_START= /DNA_END= /DNA_ORIENTATION=
MTRARMAAMSVCEIVACKPALPMPMQGRVVASPMFVHG